MDCSPDLDKLHLPATTAKARGQAASSSKVHLPASGKKLAKKPATASAPDSRRAAARQSEHTASAEPAAASTTQPAGTSASGVALRSDQEHAGQMGAQLMPNNASELVRSDTDMANTGDPDVPRPDDQMVVPTAGTAEDSIERSEQTEAGVSTAAPVLLPGGSSRFSTRHLKQKLDAKLPVSKANPLGLPPTPLLPPIQQ